MTGAAVATTIVRKGAQPVSARIGQPAIGSWGWLPLLLCFALLVWHGALQARPAPASAAASVPVPAMHSRVVDLTGTLSTHEAEALRDDIHALEQRSQAQLAVLIVPSTGDDSIEQYATRVFAQWQLGRRDEDDGVLLLVALNDRHMRIEVGTGLEGRVTDIQAARVLDQQLKPRFRDGDHAGGLQAAVQALSRLIEAPSGAIAVDEEAPPVPKEAEPSLLRRLLDGFSTPTPESQSARALLAVMAWTLGVGAWHGSRPPLPSGPRVVSHGTGKRGRTSRRLAEREAALLADLRTEAAAPLRRRWPTVLALLAAGPLAAALVLMNFALAFILFMPVSFMYAVGYLSGRFRTARRVFGGIALALAGLVGLGFYLGADKVPWLVGGLFITCFVGIGLAVVVAGVRFHWRRGVLGFMVRLALVAGVIGFALVQLAPGAEPDERWLGLAAASFIALVFGFFPANSGDRGDDDDDDDRDSGWRSSSSSSGSSSSSSSSSDSSSSSGGGGSSSGGGASDSW